MIIRPWRRLCAISSVVLALSAGAYASPAEAQRAVGTITGTVLDSSGGVLPGATVTVTSLASNEVRTTSTDAAGTYSIPNLTAGTYRVEVQLHAFKRFVRSDAPVQADAITRVDARLEPGDFAETSP